MECLNSGWVSSKGPFVQKFEKAFAKFVGSKYAVASSSGTSALHLALTALGINKEDEVILPTLTMIAAAFPIIYLGAKPVLVDVDEKGNIDTKLIEKKINKKTKAILVVHLNGHPADMKPILEIGRKYKLAILEDAAEAHGVEYKLDGQWRKVGSMGDLGCFSLYGNKLITAGEGGMAVTNSKVLADKMRSLRNFARTEGKHFLHQEISFSYRMSNLQAALGLAQLEEVNKFIRIKHQIISLYIKQLQNMAGLSLQLAKDYAKNPHWYFSVIFQKDAKKNINHLINILKNKGVETRNFVIPLHYQPAFLKHSLFTGENYPQAEYLSKHGLCLPTGPKITDAQIKYICKIIKKALQ